MAARGLISLIRTINPKLLPKKNRWRPKTAAEGSPSKSDAETGPGDLTDSGSDSEDKITPEFPVTKEAILGGEFDKKARIESAAEKKKERFRARPKGGGTTNEDKKRKKHFVLTKHRAAVRERGRRTAAAKGKALGLHAQRMKMKSRRMYKRKAR